MENTSELIAFGPIPSRRLGQSLGINNIPPKSCTYSCVYCQVGRTRDMPVDRKEFYQPKEILREVKKKISEAGSKGEVIDYLSFVPDGEPTLDINLGREIDMLRPSGIRIAVITNASLIWEKPVRDDLCRADWVSVKIDAVSENAWRGTNRPYRSLKLENILRGISEFSLIFKGTLTTETMLIQGVNDGEEEIKSIAGFISGINAARSYISVPTRPPAEQGVRPADEDAVNRAYQLFIEKGIDTECLTGYEGNAFAFTGDIKRDLLSITAVHPMRKEAVAGLLDKADAGWDIVENLIKKGDLLKVRYRGRDFYVRKTRL
ncbi:MAG: radical SAM protein [Candidatus Omnitrophica bacterium]|nr:radical SAM protein [Candidatus Omnitrophota bacterium]